MMGTLKKICEFSCPLFSDYPSDLLVVTGSTDTFRILWNIFPSMRIEKVENSDLVSPFRSDLISTSIVSTGTDVNRALNAA